jgi:ATP-dependent Clp protease ATP-binding subunit ClpC
MLLQILEDGVLTDGQGNKVKFNNTVVILTSNLGAAEMYDDQELGFVVRTKADEKKLAEEYEASKNAAMRELKKAMRPELINRLDSIEVFHALTKKQVEKIFDNLIEDLKKRLAEKSIGLKLDEDVKEFLIQKGYDPKHGARPLRRAIEDYLESELSELIISEDVKKGEIVSATLKDEKIILKVLKKEK